MYITQYKIYTIKWKILERYKIILSVFFVKSVIVNYCILNWNATNDIEYINSQFNDSDRDFLRYGTDRYILKKCFQSYFLELSENILLLRTKKMLNFEYLLRTHYWAHHIKLGHRWQFGHTDKYFGSTRNGNLYLWYVFGAGTSWVSGWRQEWTS